MNGRLWRLFFYGGRAQAVQRMRVEKHLQLLYCDNYCLFAIPAEIYRMQ